MEENKKEHKILKRVMLIIAIVVLLAIIVVLCTGYIKKAAVKTQNPVATMEVEGYGTIKIELYPDKAPNTVKNFIALANNGYYDGLKFHRVVKDFMIQGGGSAGDGTGNVTLKDLYGEDYEDEDEKSDSENTSNNTSEENTEKTSESYVIKGEFIANKFTQNDLNLTEGVIAMARADYTQYSSSLYEESYNSAGSQFFIMTTNDHTNLSGYYAGFGKVIEGMDVVKKIAEVEVEAKKSEDSSEDTSNAEVSTPKKDVKIKTVTVETYGEDYGKPETLEPFDYMTWLYSYYGISTN